MRLEREAVTKRDADVTENHGASRGVTPALPAFKRSKELPCRAQGSTVLDVFTFWQEHLGHRAAKLDTKRERLIRERLKTYSVEQLQDVVRGCKLDPFSMGENDRHTKFDSVGVIFRDAEHVEKFLAIAQQRVAHPNGSHNGVAATQRMLAERDRPWHEDRARASADSRKWLHEHWPEKYPDEGDPTWTA